MFYILLFISNLWTEFSLGEPGIHSAAYEGSPLIFLSMAQASNMLSISWKITCMFVVLVFIGR